MANPRPGVSVQKGSVQTARGDETDTGRAFITGFAERGPIGTAVLVNTLEDFVTTYGNRVSYGALYDWLDAFFNLGGSQAFISRVGGSGASVATRTLVDRAGTPLSTLRVDAKYPGSYGSRISVAIVNGTLSNTFDVNVLFDSLQVESFPGNATPAAAVTATATSSYIVLTDLASVTAPPNNNPAVLGATALTGGNDNHSSAVEADWTTALTAFSASLGPGQVAAPGRTTVAAQQALIDHDTNNNRIAYLDVPDNASQATLTAAAAALAAYNGARNAGLFGSWFTIPALAGSATPRAVPGSALGAGLTARIDSSFETAGQAPAGDVAPATYALGVDVPTPSFTDDQYTALNSAGVIMARNLPNRGVRLYGFRSVTSDPAWLQLNWSRELMFLTAEFNDIGQQFLFRQIDGRGQLFAEFAGDLSAICSAEWNANSLFGDVAEDAYSVDVSSAVNTPTTIAAGEVHAVVYVKVTPFVEYVAIEVDKAPLSVTFADASTQGGF